MEYVVIGDNVFFGTSGDSIKAANLKPAFPANV